MAMPGGIETYRHYKSMSSFRQDECDRLAKGWITEGFTTREVSHRSLLRLLGRHSGQEVDAHYMRSD
jgi:hypothetical protein